jgi:hypothetical protein
VIDVKRPNARLIGGALVATMVLGSALGAEAATKKKKHKKPVKITRTVTLKYQGGCTIDTPAVGASLQGDCAQFGLAGWEIATKPGEKYATVTSTDASGRATAGAFWESGGANGTSTTTDFCGSLKNYVVPAGGSVKLALDAVGGNAKCPGLATQGTVTVVFSNLP